MIEFNCPRCEKLLRTNADKIGAQARCPGCGELLTVPEVAVSPPLVEDHHSGFDEESPGYPREETITSPTRDEFWGAGQAFGGQTQLPPGQKPAPAKERPRTDLPRTCPMCGQLTSMLSAQCEHCGERLQPVSGKVSSRRRRSDLNYAGFWLRFVAFVVDWILLMMVMLPLAVGVILVTFGFEIVQKIPVQGDPRFDQLQLVGWGLSLFNLLLGWLYFAVLECSKHQSTFGKRLMGIIVTDWRGQRINFSRATGRYFGRYLLFEFTSFSYLFYLWFFGFFLAGFTEQKQALHDMIASTLVLRKD